VRVLLTGAGGQLGRAITASAPPSAVMTALTHRDLDIADEHAVGEQVSRADPELIINAAAYTAVDRAESEPQQAERVNAHGPAYLARAARACGARLIQVSTDYVFAGRASVPYAPGAAAHPINVYGSSKRAGELAVLECLDNRALVLRTAWLYSPAGSNFVLTMLRVMRSEAVVRVVADQIGTPTSAESVANILWTLAERPELEGIHHFTDAGTASWYDFARAIAEDAADVGLLRSAVTVEPIAAAEYAAAARRPSYSVLDSAALWASLKVSPVHWRARLRGMLEAMARG
jgi:dTDP-4-dehydrorhamnose reductase